MINSEKKLKPAQIIALMRQGSSNPEIRYIADFVNMNGGRACRYMDDYALNRLRKIEKIMSDPHFGKYTDLNDLHRDLQKGAIQL